MIHPIVAGQFYPAGKEALIKQLEKCFSSAKPSFKGKALGVIAPHAGYVYSGNGAAFSYKAIRKAKRFIILAPDHNGLCFNPTTTKEDFETPLGIVKTDTEFVEKLKAKCSFMKEARIQEHAVEVQLPFLQHLLKDFRIVPIVIPSPEYYKELGKAIASLAKDSFIICSSDFTHYGASYGYVPFSEKEAKQGMKKLDSGAIKFIEKLDAEGFLKYVQETGATICGEYAIATAIEAVKAVGAKKGVLLNYYTSGDISEDYSLAVGYASVAFV